MLADYWQSLPNIKLITRRASFGPAAVKNLLLDRSIHHG